MPSDGVAQCNGKSGFNYLLPIASAVALIVFVLQSYPMMRPGYDVWWHLGIIDAPSSVNSEVLPKSRIVWHHFWHLVFEVFEIKDVFARALIVHRTQFLATLLLVSSAAYLMLRSTLYRTDIKKNDLGLAAIWAAIIWLTMTGTVSAPWGAVKGDIDVQSWIVWYSVNYQISLPICIFSCASLLYGLTAADNMIGKVVALSGSVVSIGVGTLIHAAETAYFLLFVIFLGFSFLRGKKFLLLAAGFVSAFSMIAWLALSQSYAAPGLLQYFGIGGWERFVREIGNFGTVLTDGGLNRADTGWNVLHTISIACMLFAALITQTARYLGKQEGNLNSNALLFLVLTAILPIGLNANYGAGFLAMLTHVNIAWRFAFASLVFVGIPILIVYGVHYLRISSGFIRQLSITILIALVVGVGLTLSHGLERLQPSYRFAQSLIASTNAEKMYFELPAKRKEEVLNLSQSLRAQTQGTVFCTDIGTAYYLFFVERYQNVALPESLQYVPGFKASTDACEVESRQEPSL